MRGVTRELIKSLKFVKFQLTRLMRGVTAKLKQSTAMTVNFNSHASCEA